MKIPTLYTLIITLMILHIVGNANAMQEPSWAVYYPAPVAKEAASEPCVRSKTLLLLSEKTIKDTLFFIHSTNECHVKPTFGEFIINRYKDGWFDDTQKTSMSKPEQSLVQLLKNEDKKPGQETQRTQDQNSNTTLCSISNPSINNSLQNINKIGKEQDKKIYLTIGTTTRGALEIMRYLEQQPNQYLENVSTIRFVSVAGKEIPQNPQPKIHHISVEITPFKELYFYHGPIMLGNDKLHVIMCMENAERSRDACAKYLESEIRQYCSSINVDDIKKQAVDQVKKLKDQMAFARTQQHALAKETAKQEELERQQEAKRIAELEKAAEKAEADRIAAENARQLQQRQEALKKQQQEEEKEAKRIELEKTAREKAEADRIATEKEEQLKQEEEKLERMSIQANITIEKAKKKAEELAAAAEKAAQTRKNRIYATLCTGGVIAGVYLATCLLNPKQAENHFSFVLNLIETWYSRLTSKLA